MVAPPPGQVPPNFFNNLSPSLIQLVKELQSKGITSIPVLKRIVDDLVAINHQLVTGKLNIVDLTDSAGKLYQKISFTGKNTVTKQSATHDYLVGENDFVDQFSYLKYGNLIRKTIPSKQTGTSMGGGATKISMADKAASLQNEFNQVYTEVTKGLTKFDFGRINIQKLNDAITRFDIIVRDTQKNVTQRHDIVQMTNPVTGGVSYHQTKEYLEAVRKQRQDRRLEAKRQEEAIAYQDFVSNLPPRIKGELYKADPQFFSTVGTERVKARRDYDPQNKIYNYRFSQKDEKGNVIAQNIATDQQGNLLTSTSKKYQTLTGEIGRNIKEFFRWTIAVALIYGPLQKLDQLIQTAIQNEVALTNTLITLGESQDATNKVFSAASEIADKTGTSISAVLEGYNLAVRAAGEAASSTERYAIANKLLADSISLAKISGMSQAEATDTLTASLKQMNMPLTEGEALLDKWIKVSRIANVDVKTLATSFGIVAESAKNAGLNVDDLNGLIAVVAESGTTSARETGNAVRAIISGYTTDSSRKELSKYGISPAGAGGQIRPFKDVFGDISTKVSMGAISKEQLFDLANVLGGGNRRMTQVILAVSGAEKAAGISKESALAGNETQRALQMQLDTVASKATLLGNAFQRLAQIIGTEGGILTESKFLLDVVTKLTDVLAGIMSALGTSSTSILMGGVGAFALGKNGYEKFTGGLANVYSRLNYKSVTADDAVIRTALQLKRNEAITPELRKSYALGDPGLKSRSSKFATTAAPYILGGAFALNTALIESGRTGLAGGLSVSAGALAGMGTALAAGFGAKGASIGLMVGSSIAESFINYAVKLSDRVKFQVVGGKYEEETGQVVEEAPIQGLDRIYQAIGFGNVAIGKALYSAQNLGLDVSRTLGTNKMSDIDLLALLGVREGGMSVQEVAQALAENNAVYDLMGGSMSTPWNENVTKKMPIGQFGGYGETGLEYLNEKLLFGGVSAAEYRRKKELVTTMPSTLQSYTAPFQMKNVSYDELGFGSVEEMYSAIADIIIKGNEEFRSELDNTKGSLESHYNLLNSMVGEEIQDTSGFTWTRESLSAQIEKDYQNYRDLLIATHRNTQISLEKIPQVISEEDKTLEQINAAAAEAISYGTSLKGNLNEFERATKDIEDSQQEALIKYKDGWLRLTGDAAAYWSEGVKQATDLGQMGGLGFQFFDYTTAELKAAMQSPEYSKLRSQIQAVGGDVEETPLVMISSDKDVLREQKNWSILQQILTQIEKNTENITGVYNLPSGAEFYLPYPGVNLWANSVQGTGTGVGTVTSVGAGVPDTNLGDIEESYQDLGLSKEAIFALIAEAKLRRRRLNGGFSSPIERGGESPYPGVSMSWEEQKKYLSKPDIDSIFPFHLNEDEKWKMNESPLGSNFSTDLGSAAKTMGQKIPTLQAGLNLSMASTVTLLLDGRQVAAVVKRYLHNDLVRFSTGNTTAKISI